MVDAKSKLCMFCCYDETFGPMNVEHFVPRALWNDCRPTLTRTVPAHIECNKKYSADNEYFRDILIMEEAAQQHSEVKKFMVGKFKRKLEKRWGSVKKILVDVAERPVMTPSGLLLGYAPSFRVDWKRLTRVLQNVMRGIFYSVVGRPLPSDNKFKVFVAENYSLTPYLRLVEGMGPWSDFGDDVFRCRFLFGSTDLGSQDCMSCLMQFYGYQTFFGMTVPSNLGHTIQ